MKKLAKTILLSLFTVLVFASTAFADVTNTFWTKQANGELYTNAGNGLGGSIINVAGCNGCGGGGGGVTSLNSLTGALNLLGGENIAITPLGSNITVDFIGAATDSTLTGNGLISNPLSVAPLLTDGLTILGDGINNPLTAVQTPENKIISGGIAWSGTGYVYDVSTINYYFDGYKTAGPTQVTMAAADPTDNRFDAVVVDEFGAITVITGTPSANPAFPTIPSTQLVIGYVLVEAGTTQPTVLQDLIYDENTGPTAEWTTSTYTTGAGATGSANFNSTNSCYHGTKCADIISNQRLGARFTRSTSIDLQQFAYVQVWFRNNGTVMAANKTPTIRFENSLGNPVGNTVSLLTYGVSRNVVNTWQLAVIPVSAFGSVTQTKGLRAIVTGGTLASQANWSLDFMLMSGGIIPNGAIGPIFLSPSGTLYSSGAATGATSVQDSQFFGTLAGFGATAANYSIFEGYASGYSAVSADYSIFFGNKAGFKAANANNSNFQGFLAGYGAINADNSQFFGTRAGFGSSSAYSSTFIGTSTGEGATNAYQSVFMGRDSGLNATNASDSFFLGYLSGKNATNASTSAFLGSQAGNGATAAAGSVFLGFNSGNGAALAANAIFIGTNSGLGDTVDNTGGGTSIVIGYQSTTGGFSNSIMLGTLGANTATNQFMIGSGTFPINQVVVNGTGGIQVPVGTTGERISTQGMIRYNTTTSKFEGYDGSTWVDLN